MTVPGLQMPGELASAPVGVSTGETHDMCFVAGGVVEDAAGSTVSVDHRSAPAVTPGIGGRR